MGTEGNYLSASVCFGNSCSAAGAAVSGSGRCGLPCRIVHGTQGTASGRLCPAAHICWFLYLHRQHGTASGSLRYPAVNRSRKGDSGSNTDQPVYQ